MATLFSSSSLTIGHRIFLGFLVVLLIFASQAVVYVIGFEQAKETFTDYADHSRRVRDILDIERNIHDLQGGVLAYTYSGYDGVAARVREMQATLEDQLDKVQSELEDPPRIELLIQIRHHFRLYSENFETAIDERKQRDFMVFDRLNSVAAQSQAMVTRLHDRLIAENDLKGADLSGHLLRRLLLAQRDALLFVDRPNSRLVRQTNHYLHQFSRSLEELDDHLNQVGHDHQLIEEVQRLAAEFEDAFVGMVRATRAYMHLVYVVMGGEAAEIGILASELKQKTLEEQQRVENSIIESMRSSLRIAQLVILFAIALGLYLAWRIGYGIAEPIRSLTRAITGLARGRMDVEIPGKGRGDEIGAMAMAAHVFKERAHELANASRYKSEFLANMSHELRTPLNSMLILAKVLANNEEGNLSSSQQESAQVIHDSGVDLLRLINDILDLTKIEAGRMEVWLEEKSFQSLARLLERMFQPLAEQKGLEFAIHLHRNLPELYTTDWAKVEQVMRNFLANAIKFTSKGYIHVDMDPDTAGRPFMNADLQAGHVIALRVSDSGIGIPLDKQERIFEAFRQVDGSTSRRYGGTGLGLSISRRFADLLGGEIQVESTEGEGSSFTLYLPERPSAAVDSSGRAAASVELHADSQGSSDVDFVDRSRLILIVDDDRRNIYALKMMLANRVGVILSAGNGLDALSLLDEYPDTDLILMDIMMPGIDGYQTMERIRQQPRFSKLPIIALTAKAMPGDRELCLNAGASDYLAKPVESDRLLEMLAVWLSKPRLPVVVDGQTDSSQPLPKVRVLSDENPNDAIGKLGPLVDDGRPVRVLIVDDDMRNTFALTHALEGKVEKVVMARDGQRALDELASDGEISIVLMDIMMPVMDGYETMRRIRAVEKWQELPILALTARAQPGEWERCREAGADDCLIKPVQLAELVAKMRALLAIRSQEVITNDT